MRFPYNKVLEIRQQYQKHEITREEAKELLAFVLELNDSNDFSEDARDTYGSLTGANEYFQKNYGSYGPLLRLSDVCTILRTWALAYQKHTGEPEQNDWDKEERKKFTEAWQYIDIQISKSCLLDRLFFQKEGLRTVPCPAHKGRWSGCSWDSPGCSCRNGSNVTGWLPAEEYTGYSDDPNAPICDFCGKPPLKQGLWSGRVDGKHGHPECMDLDEKMKQFTKALTDSAEAKKEDA